nr:MAG TPA: hypothetical protein [Crassvirales sp.]DAX57613.1 MAG TPA: hypothetical protein [Crassvirales sp.]
MRAELIINIPCLAQLSKVWSKIILLWGISKSITASFIT